MDGGRAGKKEGFCIDWLYCAVISWELLIQGTKSFYSPVFYIELSEIIIFLNFWFKNVLNIDLNFYDLLNQK